VGVYTVDIQLGIDANANVSGSGTAVGAAAYGLGSLTVESVREPPPNGAYCSA